MTPRWLRPTLRLTIVLVVLSSPFASSALAAPAAKPAKALELEPKHFKELAWRSVGPANMGGRISDLAVVEKKPGTLFAAISTGGLFKSSNLGITWTAVFDTERVASTGAVAVWQKNPMVVWCGTGEANSRNSSSWGRGIYRSLDGGGRWNCMGLEATSAIARVCIDPNDSNTVFVAALGRLWGENPERGIYVTHDGGATWTHSLKLDAKTGAIDLALDPSDSKIVYAAMYARRRTPWSYSGVSEAGGLYKSSDGGRSWKKLTAGLPKRTGRIGLAVWAKRPSTVYAVIESDEGGRLSDFESKSRAGGVFRSDDRGESWTRLSPYAPRPFYFSQIRVQPDDSTRVYLLGTDLWVSDDGGVTFRGGGAKNVHPDFHAMWIDPSNGDHVIAGNDGGVYHSWDRTASWEHLNNLAIGEFYNITADARDPYWIYGGLQDNQSWGGPSRTRFEVDGWFDDTKGRGILNDHWFVLGGGDGFHVAVDPNAPDTVYYESQQAYVERMDLKSGKIRNLRPSNNEGEPTFRFNWNSPLVISKHEPGVLWLGGNCLFRLYDHGDHWDRVSPDLSTRDPDKMTTGGSGAENYCTIVSVSESPRQQGLLWCGTDDGKVWVTPNGGASWEDLTRALPKAVAGLYVSRIEASHHDARVAYVSFDGHRSDVFQPYVYVTRDRGKSWSPVIGDLPSDGPVKVIREDLENPNLLFAGTEFGCFVSLDGGRKWMRLREGLPTVAVDDILIHPRERDLIIGTHGRSIYVLDGIQALEQWSPSVPADSVTLFVPRAATAFYPRSYSASGQRPFFAKNPPFGAWFDYFVSTELEGGVSLAVADSAGRAVRKLTGPGTVGFHRVAWDLQPGEPNQRLERTEWNGQPAYVRVGRYTVTLSAGQIREQKQSFDVRQVPNTADPGF